MEKSVFDFGDYRSYLLFALGPAGHRTGARTRACKELGCHATYLSQVLTDKVELSLEYGEAFNRFFKHRANEADYFILLLLRDRAGSAQLRERFQTQIEAIRSRQRSLKSRVKEVSDLSTDAHEQFYSSWIYGAVHALASLPKYVSQKSVADSIGLTSGRVSDVFLFLQKIGLVASSSKGFEIGPRHVHLAQDSKFIKSHHTNWRLHAIQSLEDPMRDDPHYSGAVSLSKTGANIVRDKLLQTFQESMKVVRDDKEEVAYVYNFDFYRLDR